jgi:hypothetical protein
VRRSISSECLIKLLVAEGTEDDAVDLVLLILEIRVVECRDEELEALDGHDRYLVVADLQHVGDEINQSVDGLFVLDTLVEFDFGDDLLERVEDVSHELAAVLFVGNVQGDAEEIAEFFVQLLRLGTFVRDQIQRFDDEVLGPVDNVDGHLLQKLSQNVQKIDDNFGVLLARKRFDVLLEVFEQVLDVLLINIDAQLNDSKLQQFLDVGLNGLIKIPEDPRQTSGCPQ